MSKPNLDTLPRQHPHPRTERERARLLACPSGSEGTDGPTKHCTADPCSYPSGRRQLGGAIGGEERQRDRVREGREGRKEGPQG